MKRRRKSKFFIVIIVLLLTIITCIIFYFHITNKFEYRNKITIEVGEDIPTIEDYFYEKNMNLLILFGMNYLLKMAKYIR